VSLEVVGTYNILQYFNQSLSVGQMGLGIAYVAALRAKVPVLISDRSHTQIKSGLALFDKLLAKDTDKGKITTEEAREARDRLRVVEDLKSMRDVDMVVEVSKIVAFY
jgi:3-hydroxybutyryl-CoA dehydrogenase